MVRSPGRHVPGSRQEVVWSGGERLGEGPEDPLAWELNPIRLQARYIAAADPRLIGELGVCDPLGKPQLIDPCPQRQDPLPSNGT